MEKKLLSIILPVFFIFLSSWSGFGQSCTGTAEVTISSNAPSNTICAGESVTFTASPLNAGNPTYQWQVNGVNRSGATSSTFAVSNLQNGHVVTVVMNPNCTGESSVTSSGVAVTVNPIPSVTTANTATICSGTGPNISLTASTPSSFSWTVGTITGGITGSSAGSGATINQTLTNPGNTAAGTVQYIVTPTATTGGCQGTPHTITVTVNPTPSVTTANTATICSGAGPNISLTASTPSSFAWTIGTITGGITGASAGSGATINQTLTNPSNSTAGTVQYIVTPTATAGGCAGSPFTITVTVNPNPSISTANTSTICSGAGPNISLIASTPSSFAWTIGSITGGITGASAGSGASINQTLTNPSNSAAGTVQYIVTPTANAGSCVGTPYTITVTVNPKPSISTANTSTICSGAGLNISLTASTPSSFAWTIGTITGSITGASAGNGATINQTLTNPSNSAVGTVQYIVTPTATSGSCAGTPYTITVTVNPNPSISTANTSTICSGAGPNISLTASTPSSFAWTIGTITGGITGASAGTGSTINQTLTNPINSTAGTVQYIVTPTATAGGCAGTPYTITVTVNPRPSVTTGNTATVCSGFGPNISLAATTPSSFSWTIGTITGGITGASAGSGATINQTLTNPSNSTTGTVQYIVTPTATAGSCAGTPSTITVTVNPTLVPSVSITSTSTAICSTAPSGSSPVTFTATPTNGGATPTYQWKNGATNVGTNSATYTANALANGSQISVVMTSIATCASPVTATSNTITMTAYTPPAVPVFAASSGNVNVSSGVCPPVSGLVYTVTADPNITSYDWVVPSGWIITGGAGTNSITVDVTGAADSGGSFNVIASAKNACGTSSQRTFAVNVNKSASVYAGLDKSICKGGTIGLTGEASGYAQRYIWTANPNIGTFSDNTSLTSSYTPPATFSGTVTLILTTTKTTGNPNCPEIADEMILTVNAAPAISGQPSTTPQTLCINVAATQLAVTATGAGLTYQWYSNTTNSNSGGTLLTGATSSTYTPVTTTAGTLYYYVDVNGTCTPTVKSNVSGAVTVNAPPAITVQPSTTSQTLCKNAAATQLSVTVTGVGLTYQWYSNSTNSNSGGTSLGAGATSSTYTPVTSTAGTLYYYVIISGTCTPPVTSNVSGAVTVNEAPAITVQPSTTTETLCLNAAATQMSVTATGAGLTYQWYSNATNSNSGGTSLGAGATSSTYTPVTSTAGTLFYYVIVSGTCTPPVTSSVSGSVTVNEAPAITGQPSTTPQTLCLNAAATQLAFTATGAGLTYQWYSNATNSNSGGTSLGAGATSSTYTPVTSTAGTLFYYVIISGTCTPPVTSNVSGAVTINEAPAITVQPSTTTETLCLNAAATQMSVTATGAGLTYQWYSNATNSNSGGTLLTGATSSTFTPVTSTAGTLYYYVIVSGTCTPSTTSNVSGVVTVNEAPVITGQPSTTPQTLCLNTAAAQLAVTASGAGLTYQWYSNTSNSNSGGTSLGAGATSSTYTPVTSTAGTLYYYVIVSGTCTPPVTSSISGSVTVNEAPAITVQPAASQTICSGFPVSFSVTATGTGLTYEWFKNGTTTGITSATLSISQAAVSDAGTYKVVVKGADPCGNVTSDDAVLIVNENINITTQPSAQVICEGNNTSFSVTATGTGLSYQWRKDGIPVSNGAIISGATTNTLTFTGASTNNAGSYDVVISGTDGTCSQIISNPATFTVNPNNAVTLTSASGTVDQTLCVNTALTNITYSTTGATGATFAGLPAGITGGWAGNVATISGTPTVAGGPFNYTVTLTGGCSEVTATGTINVNPDNTVNLTSAANTNSQTVCINTALTNITYSTTGATGASFSGLPAGVTGAWTGNIVNISGTPTVAGGPFNYTVTLTGGCSVVTATGTINVTPDNTVNLTSAANTNSQTLCINTALTNITYSTTGATGASFAGLPAGITGAWANNTVTISGIPTAAGGPTTYTVTLTGGCSEVTATGTINVSPDNTVNLTSAANTNSQTLCINTALTNITYSTTGATGASFSGLPAGVTGGWAGNVATISGTPTVAGGPFNYTVTLTGGCSEVTATGTINVTPDNTVNLTSAANTNSQTLCINTALTNITYSTTGATGASFTGLPAGVTGSWAGNIATISGTPTVAGSSFNYTITLSGGCSVVTTTGTINVDPVSVAGTLTAPTSVCINNASGQLVLTEFTGNIIKWESKAANATTWTVLNNGSTAASQSFSNLTQTTTFRATVKSGVCSEATVEKIVTIDPLPIGGKLAFDIVTADNDGRIFTICQGARSGYKKIDLTGHTGTILAWKYSINGAPWVTLTGETGNFLSASKIQSLNLPQTTVFRVEISSGTCTPNVFSQTAILSVIATDIKPTPVTVSKDVVCLGEEVTLSSETGYSTGNPVNDGGSFDNAGIKNKGWRFTRPNGSEFNFETNANNTNPDVWSRATPRNFPTAQLTPNYSTTGQLWDPAVEDGNKGFAIVSGTNSSRMETAVFGINSMDQAILTFDQAYNLTPGASISVEISTDGGATYQTVLFSRSGAIASGNSGTFGTGTPQTRPNNKMVIDLGNYMGQNNLRLRFNYVGARTGDIWAVDAITIPGGPRDVSIEWNDYTDPNNVFQIGTTNSVKYIPKKIGLNIFEVKTKLIFDSTGNACDVAVNSENIEVFVFDKYTTSVSAEFGSCGDFSAQLKATVTNSTSQPITSYPTPDGYIGQWIITGGNYTLVDSNTSDGIDAINDPNANLSATSTGTFNVSWTLIPTAKNEAGVLYQNPETCPPVVTPLDIIIEGCIALDFDGEDDVIVIDNAYTDVVSIEAWIRPEVAGGTIISGPNFRITTPTEVTPNSRWYHIAVTGGKLYIDGIEKGNLPLGTGGTKTLIGADWTDGAATSHFSGWIEEVRLWKKVLTVEQIRFMMNQRLIPNGAQMGEQIPMDVPGGLTYADLSGYYRLISAVPDPLLNLPFNVNLMPANGLTPDLANTAIPGRLLNMETNQENTAPLPYFSGNNGLWGTDGTWARPAVWDPPHTGSIEWNIVRTSHNIQSGQREIKVLGLISVINTLEMIGTNPGGWVGGGTGNPLYISHYLKLDGVIDLNGESQLVQPQGSIVDGNSTGSLQRDQQGTANSYNYNYWSSPVSGAGNAPYTVAGVLKDGTTLNPGTVTFGDPHGFADAGKTDPIKISNYWISTFNGTVDDYGSWNFQYGSASPIKVGEGYTMKGTSGAVGLSTAQNYTFVGLPNNGDINLASISERNYLLGNPYPSAIDAEEFIKDNLGVRNGGNNYFDGTLYFWDHFGKEDSHILLEYVGGYAALNLSGAVPAISFDERINDNMVKNNKFPGAYIPVGQGFFVNTSNGDQYSINSGQIKFKNSQREFVTEVIIADSQFLRPEVPTKNSKKEEVEKIRISFKSPLGYFRQILVGAIPSTTNGFDLGYDAPLYDYNPEDMYWIQGNNWLVIQGVPDFNKEQILPLGVNLKDKGEFSIQIDNLENIADNKNIYIKDKELDTIHDLRSSPYKATAEGGYHNDRFEIVFHKEVAAAEEPPVVTTPKPDPGIPDGGGQGGEEITNLTIRYSHSRQEVQILNPDQLTLSNMYIFDLNGNQLINHRNISHEKDVRIPVRNYSSGVYIVKLYSEGNVISKKIIINN